MVDRYAPLAEYISLARNQRIYPYFEPVDLFRGTEPALVISGWPQFVHAPGVRISCEPCPVFKDKPAGVSHCNPL
jgi:hypothetical protein